MTLIERNENRKRFQIYSEIVNGDLGSKHL